MTGVHFGFNEKVKNKLLNRWVSNNSEDHDKDDGNKVAIIRNKAQDLYKVFIGDDDYEGQILNLR
jgi:hypothetical protein